MRGKENPKVRSKVILNIFFGALILFCIFLTSCAVRPQSAIAHEPDKARSSQVTTTRHVIPEYCLGFGDVIEVKFFNDSQFNETVPIRPDGRISLQRVGDIKVVGMTPSTLDEIITQTYSKILRNPDVTVIVREFGGQQCYVMGEVQNPGAYPITRGMTLLRAIAVAGGPKLGANLRSVVFIRDDGKNRRHATRLDVSLAAVKDNLKADVPVQGYDMIYVPKTFISDVNAFVSQLYDVVLPPLDVWTRYKYWYSR